MPNPLGREIHTSTNGDSWWLVRDPISGWSFVRHVANPASGGHVSDIALSAFLAADHDGPEHQELWRLIGTLAEPSGTPGLTAFA